MSDEALVYIYALSDPRNGEVRYVGKTINLKQRFDGHLAKSKIVQTHCASWIKSLASEGLVPEMSVLRVTDERNWRDVEREIIATLRSEGIRLTNIQDGGEGGNKGQSLSETTRQKMSESHKAVGVTAVQSKNLELGQTLVKTEEHRARISDGMKRRWAVMTADERQATIDKMRAGRTKIKEKRG